MTGVTHATSAADLAESLAASLPFRGLPAAHLKRVLEAARRRQVERDAFFFRQGDPATTFYLLVQGEAKLLWLTPAGYQALVRLVTPGEEVGLVALLGSEAYNLSAQAVGDCLALAWEGATLARLVEGYPRIAFNLLDMLVTYYKQLLERCQEQVTARVEQRLARALLRLGERIGQPAEEGIWIGIALSREDLAELTGTTQYSASRSLSQWEGMGLLETRRDGVLLCQVQALAAIAEGVA